MRYIAERFSALPFSIGCVSESSVAVSKAHEQKISQPAEPTPPSPKGVEGESQSNSSAAKMKSSSFVLLSLQKPNITAGIQRLVKSFKSLSHLFIYREEEEDGGDEGEMEIGFPTDVKHVAHIGLDGDHDHGGVTNSMKSWDKASELFSQSSLSMRQLQLAMAAAHEG